MKIRYFVPLFALPLVCGMTVSAFAQAKKPAAPPKKPPVKNEVKGQGQLSGVYGTFGTTYSLQNNFNVTLLSAHYTEDVFAAYTTLAPATDEKIFVLEFALKNVSQSDNFFDAASFITLVDEKGTLYPDGSYRLRSNGEEDKSINLKPGQGVGQPNLKDPLEVAFKLPRKVRIVKIMINQGRLGKAEKVLRFPVAGATKEEAGEDGDPKNVIAPLPENVRDDGDKSGAVGLAVGKGKIGEYVPSSVFQLRLDNVAASSEAIGETAPDEGKKWVIATVTAKSFVAREYSMFDVTGGDFPLHELTDGDGECYKPVFYRKAKKAEDAEHTFKKDDEYTFRIVFAVPKDAAMKTLVLGAGNSRKWSYDVSSVK